MPQAPGDPQTADPFAGDATLSRYAFVRPIGEGTFGEVLQARHQITGRDVAVKLLKPTMARDHTTVSRFFQEARAATAIGHTGIVEVLDAGVSSAGQPFLVMELLTGRTLREQLTAEGPLGPEEVLSIGRQLLAVLESTHTQGIVHRDLKPDNLFLVPTGTALQLKVLDFGISKFVDRVDVPLTRTEATMGTPHYMAPEQFLHAATVDHRADLYATAVILYECLSGRRPFAHIDEFRILMAVLQTEQPPSLRALRPDVPPHLAHAIDRGLERDRQNRWPSAAAFAAAMADGWRQEPAAPLAPTLATYPPRPGSGTSDDAAVAQTPPAPPAAHRLSDGSKLLLGLAGSAAIGAMVLLLVLLPGRDSREARLPLAAPPKVVQPEAEPSRPRADTAMTAANRQPPGAESTPANAGPAPEQDDGEQSGAERNGTPSGIPEPKRRLRVTIQGNPFWAPQLRPSIHALMGRFRRCTEGFRGSFQVDVRTTISKEVSSARPLPTTAASQCAAQALRRLNVSGVDFPGTTAQIVIRFQR